MVTCCLAYAQKRRVARALSSLILVVLLEAMSTASVTYQVLHNFSGSDGANPSARLFMDPQGNLFGVTQQGGNYAETQCQEFGCGVAFQMKPAVGGGWDYNVIHTFCKVAACADGAEPVGGLIADSSGNLYGAAAEGGNNAAPCQGYSCGLIYKLTPTAYGEWKFTILYRFSGSSDGWFPIGGLVFDSTGSLYGVALYGGDTGCVLPYVSYGCGVVYKLVPNPRGTRWVQKILYTFTGPDGAAPVAGLIFDTAGNLYGTTESGGQRNYNLCTLIYCGLLFQLSPTPSGPWQETIVHEFTGHGDGGLPTSNLIFDTAGNLYGTSAEGGFGDVYEFIPQIGGGWKEKVIGSPGGNVYAPVLMDGAGNLWSTTANGLVSGFIFEFVHNPDDSWSEVVQYTFCSLDLCADGGQSYAGLISDSHGNMYGVTFIGGTNINDGVVFELRTDQ